MTFDEVRESFDNSVTEASRYQAWMTELDDARYCKWAGQTTDGRKWEQYIGKEVFPWDGASDMRPFFIDDLVNDDVDIMRTADKNCHMQTVPVNSTYAQQATAQTSVLDFVARGWMAEELEREKELLAQWRQHYGASVMGIDWWMDFDSEIVTITVQDILAMAQQNPEFAAALSYLADNRGQLSQQDLAAAASMIQTYFPAVTNPGQALQSLMTSGQFQFDNPYIKVSRPCVTALRIFQDVFFLQNSFEIQKLPWIVRRDVIPKPAVEDRAQYEQWNPAFTKEVIAHAGENSLAVRTLENLSRYAGDRLYVDQLREQCEVFYAFYKGLDQGGKRRTWVTIFHPSTKVVGRTLPHPYRHGKYPFVLCLREKRSRNVTDARGIGDISITHQSELKNQRDSRNDRTSLGTLPPLQVPLGRGKQQYRLGPRAQLGVMRPGELAWLQPPPLDQTSFDVENKVLLASYNYFGKLFDGIDPNKVLRKQQRLIDGWLSELREVYGQIYELCEQYLSPDDWLAIGGDPASIPPSDRQSIQHNISLVLEYDAKDLNTEYLTAKLNMIQTMLVATDAAGVIDRAGLTFYAANALDPALGRQICRPQGQVTQQEISEEQDALSNIVTGVDPPVYSSGQNAQLRLQVIQSTLQNNQDYLNFIRQNPLAQERLQRRIQNMQFQIAQQNNAITGRIGVPPNATTQLTGAGPAPPPQGPPNQPPPGTP
ncbi:MAG TPA: hypothetical protein VFO40_15660 [Chthoniobacterales bacterium]|nr:hypothetical protein [Chthoniobacterales bacterium]